MIGVLLDTDNTPVMNARLFAIEEEANQRGYRILVGRVRQDRAMLEAFLADFQGWGMDGLICLFDMTARRDRLLRDLIPPTIRTVFHGRPLRAEDAYVQVNTQEAIFQLVSHLVETGRQRIGLTLWNTEDRLMKVRMTAYKDALCHFGVPVSAPLIWQGKGPASDTPSDSVEQAIDALVVEQRVDALIASNDLWAVRLMGQLRERGYAVPEQVAVTGYDNLDVSQVVSPSLTTIDQQHPIYAREMLDRVLQSGELKTTASLIQPQLVIRDSSRRALT
jgi:DNA-binding LacI/PurR family transcriptional regulator